MMANQHEESAMFYTDRDDFTDQRGDHASDALMLACLNAGLL